MQRDLQVSSEADATSGVLADKTKTAADQVSESIVDVMGFVDSSTKRIAAM
ncbi:MAG: hypothetical protein NMNS01_27090 [Nitrosomonas sp.]|nr:MAG: hypothetical protein NMNS01_27090 [Nitrosomonas sp.]